MKQRIRLAPERGDQNAWNSDERSAATLASAADDDDDASAEAGISNKSKQWEQGGGRRVEGAGLRAQG